MAWFYNNESVPVIAVLDNDGNQLFQSAVNMRCRVKHEKVYPEHPLENANVIFDDVYPIPTEASLDFVLNPDDYRDVYKEIYQAWDNNAEFTIITRVETIKNMRLPRIPHDENTDMMNTISITLAFKKMNFSQVTTQALSSDDVANPADADKVNGGKKSTSPTGSLGARGLDWLRSRFGNG